MKILLLMLAFSLLPLSAVLPATSIVAPGDTLQITVDNEPELSQSLKVSPNGTITYPFVGEVSVAGLSTDEVIQLLQELLKKNYIQDARLKINLNPSGAGSKNAIAIPDTSAIEAHAEASQALEDSRIAFGSDQAVMATVDNQEDAGTEQAAAPEMPAANRPADGKQTSYRIMPYDTIEISVYGEKDLNQTVSVSEEGTIRFPLIGQVKIAGLTSDEATRTIENLLKKDYLLKPQVSVLIKEHGKIYIFGAVKQPGSYELKGPLTVVDALVLAGGTKDNANLAKIKVIKKEAKEYVVDLETQGKSFFLEPLDKIVVEEYGQIYIVGAVNTPGVYNLEKSNLTPLDAILFLANGTKDNANLSAVKVIREYNGKRNEQALDLNDQQTKFILKEGDRILVDLYKDIYVFGQIKVPGKYPFKKGMTTLDAISLAGGFTDIADKNAVKVIRQDGDKKKALKVPVGYILNTGNKSKDVELREGDTISVPESWF